MTTPVYVARYVLPAAYALLPPKMQSPEATTLIIAIGFQESKFRARRQIGGGSARGFYQFERDGGVSGVFTHHASRTWLAPVLATLAYPVFVEACYTAIEHDDVLATCFARLLLWTDPRPLPRLGEVEIAWEYYLRNWRPGKPREEAWPQAYAEAIAIVAAETWQVPDEHPRD